MKIVFKFARWVWAGALLATLAGMPGSARAEIQYFSTRSVLKDFFPRSAKVTYVRFTPTARQKKSLQKKLGYSLSKSSYLFYVAKSGDTIDGYAFIGSQMGQHLPITFAVKLSPAGVVLRQEIMVYREPRGDEVRDPRFRAQFKGKTASDPVRASVDIDCISGATISSHAIAMGVRRALILFQETMRSPIQVSHVAP